MTAQANARTNTWAALPSELCSESLVGYETLESAGWRLARNVDGRFDDDRCLEGTPQGAVMLDGVLLNRSELITKTASSSTAVLLARLRRQNGTTGVLRSLRGVFSGCFIDAETRSLEVFANQTGDAAVYIYRAGGTCLASNSFDVLIGLLRENDLRFTFNERAARMILSHGFMIDGATFAQEVHRLRPGAYARVSLDVEPEFSEHQFWSLSNEPSASGSVDKLVREFDHRFRRAVSMGFDKDIEYGFPSHLADMSGGLDSRMVNFAAADLGYGPVTNITYGQFGSIDVQRARKTSEYLGNTAIIMPLDNGDCLLEPQEILKLNSGSAYYAGITGGKRMLEMINFSRVGLEHDGMLGGVVGGSWVQSQDAPVNTRAGRYSDLHNYGDLADSSVYPNQELYMMNTRGFLGAVSTHLTRAHYTYPYSPFLDIEVLEYAMSIPVSIRRNHNFYNSWLAQRYPGALSVPTTRRLPTANSFLRDVPINAQKAFDRVWGQANKRLGLPLLNSPSTMNPFEYWHQKNRRLRELLDDQIAHAREISVSSELRNELTTSVSNESQVLDRLLATTVLEMYKLYFAT